VSDRHLICATRVDERLDKALTRAVRSTENEIGADSKELIRELGEAERKATAGKAAGAGET